MKKWMKLIAVMMTFCMLFSQISLESTNAKQAFNW